MTKSTHKDLTWTIGTVFRLAFGLQHATKSIHLKLPEYSSTPPPTKCLFVSLLLQILRWLHTADTVQIPLGKREAPISHSLTGLKP